MASVAIIGGGASGVLSAYHLCKLNPGVSVYLIESSVERTGKGIAYATESESHLLNVPVSKMSLLPDEPDHFVKWLAQHHYSFNPGDFVPRKIFGQYLRNLLDTISNNITIINDEAIALHKTASGFTIELLKGQAVFSHKVLLALGNFPPTSPEKISANIKKEPNYFDDPWSKNVFDGLSPDENIFIIGTGLTMVDMVMSLHHAPHKGHIMVVSTHGFLPQVHEQYIPYPDFYDDIKNAHTVNALTIKIHRHIARAARKGINWRAVIDSIRPHTTKLWQQLSTKEKEEFMDKVRHIWGVARHRIPPESNEVISSLLAQKRLILQAARVQQIQKKENRLMVEYKLRNTQQQESFLADRVINCTGPESNYTKVPSALVKQMLAAGFVTCDPIKLGLNATADGRIIDANDHISQTLFTIGPCLKGILWESTAIPEIKHQAYSMARLLAR